MADGEMEENARQLTECQLDDETTTSQGRLKSIMRCLESLVHASTCHNPSCRRMSCHKMKRVVAHTKVCKKRLNANCEICKQFIALCCYHAKDCGVAECPVPFCLSVRKKVAAQKAASAAAASGLE